MTELESLNPTTQTESNINSTFGFWFFVGGILLILTQVVRAIVLWQDFPIFKNENFAFSLDLPLPLMVVLYLVAILFISHHLYHNWNRLYAVSRLGFVLIIAGGLSNFLERIIFGHVVDYFYILTGVLNLADFYIFLGIVLIFIQRNYKPGT